MRSAVRGTAVVVTVVTAATIPALPASAAGPTGVKAGSALLAELSSGKVRWSKAADTKRPIASVTKVMTALVVLRAGNLDRKITVMPRHINYAIDHGATRAYLRAGDKLTARQLLNAMLLPSGADAAYALADTYGPGRKNFVAKMNRVAKDLKLTRTHFANFDGLPYPTPTAGYSTAREVVKLGRTALTRPVFRTIVARKTYSLAAGGGHKAYRWVNTNRLLGSYRGANGIKTGTTDAAGYCVLFTARRDNRTLIGVVLHSTTDASRFTDAAKILNYGFGLRAATVYRVPPVPPGANVD